MTRPCVRDHLVPRAHLDGCQDEACDGCKVATAADGLQVCAWHERRVRDGLRDIPGLWADLGDPRRAKVAPGPRGDDGPPLLIADDQRQARSAIRLLLVSWCKVLADDWGLTLPADTVRAMSHHVAVQAGRLLASEHADQLVSDIEGAVGEAWRLARPGRVVGVRVPCPSCARPVRLDPEADTIRCPCGEWGDLTWWRGALQVSDPPGALTLRELVEWLAIAHRIRVTTKTVDSWARRGKLSARGVDEQGRTLWDTIEATAVALRQRERGA